MLIFVRKKVRKNMDKSWCDVGESKWNIFIFYVMIQMTSSSHFDLQSSWLDDFDILDLELISLITNAAEKE